MSTDLTEPQQLAIREHPEAPIEVRDPVTKARYILIPAETYDRLKALIAVDEFDVEEAYPLMNQVATTEGWNDPALDAYERLDPRKKQ